MAVTNPEAESPYARASQIIVPTDTPGFRRVRNIPVMGEVGGGWASHAEIRYDNCRVPRSNLLGKQGSGFTIAQERLGPGRIHHCMRWIGICERSFEMMCAYAARREIAPGKPLATRQTIQNWIAESRAEIDAARRKKSFIPHNCRILRVDPGTGKIAWERKIDELVFPCMALTGGGVFAQTPSRVFSLDLASAQVQTWRMPLPGDPPESIWHARYYDAPK